MTDPGLLDDQLSPRPERRRKLLPLWIKIFLWIFIVFGVFVPVVLIMGIFGLETTLSLYGLETQQPFSVSGLLLTAIFTIKGAVSYGLWTEKDWAVKLAIADAIIGIITCSVIMIGLPILIENSSFGFNIRFELIALIPYLLKMMKIKDEWERRQYD